MPPNLHLLLRPLRRPPFPTRSLAYKTSDESAAARRQAKRQVRLHPPGGPRAPSPRRDPSLPEATSDLVGPRLHLHIRVNHLLRSNLPDPASALTRSALTAPVRPTVFTCNAVISHFLHTRHYFQVISLFDTFFKHSNIVPNIASYNYLVKAHCETGNLTLALHVYRHIIAHAPFSPSAVTYRHLTQALVESDRISDAMLLLRESHHRGQAADSLVYNNLISGFIKLNDFDKALEMFEELRERSPVYYDGVVNANFMEAYFNMGREDLAMESYNSLMERNFRMSPFTVNTLLRTLLKHGKGGLAEELFEKMFDMHHPYPIVTVDAETYTIMVNYLFERGRREEAVKLFNRTPYKATTKETKYFHLNVGCFNNMIGKLGENGMFEEAEKVFEVMPMKQSNPDMVTYRLMIDGYFREGRDAGSFNRIVGMLCVNGQVEEAEALFDEMCSKSVEPDAGTYERIIGGLCNVDRTDSALQYLEKMMESGLKPTAASYGILATGLCLQGKLDIALLLLDKMANDVHCFNEIIGRLCEDLLVGEAEAMFDKMPEKLVKPDTLTYGTMIDGFCRLGITEAVLQYLEKMTESGLTPTPAIYGIVVTALCRDGNLDGALKMLEERVEDINCFNGIIGKLWENRMVTEAEEVFDKMHGKSVNPDADTYALMINGFCDVQRGDAALNYLQDMSENGLQLTGLETYSNLVNEMCRQGRKIDLYNRIIAMFCKKGLVSAAETLLVAMKNRSFTPDEETFGLMFDGFCRVNRAEDALSYLKKMVESRKKPTAANYGIVVTGLCTEGKLDIAVALVEEMVEDVFSFNGIIGKLCEKGLVVEAEAVFDKMPCKSVKPNTNTYELLIDGLCKVNRTEEALLYLEKIVENELKPTASIYGILVSGLCREGKLDRALTLLEAKVEGLSCFNGIIGKLCENGLISEAEVIFEKMPGKSVNPDMATYRLMINGLCKVNRNEEALQYFEKMVESGLKPAAASYEILVTELCRQGNLDRAQSLLAAMLRDDYVFTAEFRDLVSVALDKAGRSTELERLFALDAGNAAAAVEAQQVPEYSHFFRRVV